MTADDILKTVFTAVVGILTAAVGWLVRSVLIAKETILLHDARLHKMEGEIAELKKEALTVECIREVVEGALDRRDGQAAERRVEWDKMHTLEIRQVVADELERMLPRIIRELRGSSGADTPNFNAPKPKGPRV